MDPRTLKLPGANFVKEEVGQQPLWHSFVSAWPFVAALRAEEDVQYYHQRFTGILETQVGAYDWYSWLLLRASAEDVSNMLRVDLRSHATERMAQMKEIGGLWWVLLWQTRKPETEKKCKNDLRRLLTACTWCPWGAMDFEPMLLESVRERWAVWSATGADALHALCLGLSTGTFSSEASVQLPRGDQASSESLCLEDLLHVGDGTEIQGAIRRFLENTTKEEGGSQCRPGRLTFLQSYPMFSGLDCSDLDLAADLLRTGAILPQEQPARACEQDNSCAHRILTSEAPPGQEPASASSCVSCQARGPGHDWAVCASCVSPVCATCAPFMLGNVVVQECAHAWKRVQKHHCVSCGGPQSACEEMMLPAWMLECPHGEPWVPLCSAKMVCVGTRKTAAHWCSCCGLFACGPCVARLENERRLVALCAKAARARRSLELQSEDAAVSRWRALTHGLENGDNVDSHAGLALQLWSDADDAIQMQLSPATASQCRPDASGGRFQIVGSLVHPSHEVFSISRRRVGVSCASRDWLARLWAHVLQRDQLIAQRVRGRAELRGLQGPDGERMMAERTDLQHYALDALVLLRHANIFEVQEKLSEHMLTQICATVVDACAPHTKGHKPSAKGTFARRVGSWHTESAACSECGATCTWPALRRVWAGRRTLATSTLVPEAIGCVHMLRAKKDRAEAEQRCNNPHCSAVMERDLERVCMWPGPDTNRKRSLSERLGATCEGGERELWMTICGKCRCPFSFGRQYRSGDLFAASSTHARASLASRGASCFQDDTQKTLDHDRDSLSPCGEVLFP